MPTNPSGVACTGTNAGGIIRTSAPIIHCPATGRWICEDTDTIPAREIVVRKDATNGLSLTLSNYFDDGRSST